jgi:hypothetical protein
MTIRQHGINWLVPKRFSESEQFVPGKRSVKPDRPSTLAAQSSYRG